MTGFMVRIFFVIALAAVAVAAGMWMGLTIVDGFKMAPRPAIVYITLTP